MGAAVDTAKEKLGNMKTAYEENGGGIKGVVAAGWEGTKAITQPDSRSLIICREEN